jgi:hypothetical protein
MLQLPTAEEHIDQDLVFVLKEFACLIDLHVHIVVPCFGTDADFLELLLVGLCFVAFAGLLIAKFAVVQDFADWRPFAGRDLDEVELGLASQIESLIGWHDPKLFPVDAYEANRADANLLVDALIAVVLRLAIVDTLFLP